MWKLLRPPFLLLLSGITVLSAMTAGFVPGAAARVAAMADPGPDGVSVRADSTAGETTAPPDSARRREFLLGKERFGLGDSPALTLEARYPLRRSLDWLVRKKDAPLTPFEVLLHGAGRGASTAGFLGAMGAAVGFWDENTAWALIAAGASVGAIWSGLSSRAAP
jgi:hypothetical protein